MYKKRRLNVLLRLFFLLFLVLFMVFSAIHLHLGNTLHAVEDQYISETALLYVENINEKLHSINLELITLTNNLLAALPHIPEDIGPKDGKYYKTLFTASDLVGSLKSRYSEIKGSFLYLPPSDMLIVPTGISWHTTEDLGITKQVKQALRRQKSSFTGNVCWEILTYQGENYMLGWYTRKQMMLACIIDLDQIFAEINHMPESYEVISFLRWNDGQVIAPQAYYQEAQNILASGMDQVYPYPLANVGTAYIKKVKDGKTLQSVHTQLELLNVEMGVLWLGVLFIIWFCYKKLFYPFTQFIAGLENAEEEFDNLDENNILELESINEKFKNLLHRLKGMRIALYKREIMEKQTELELLQEQIRPHFFLNCLSLVHSLADKEGNREITELLEALSGYVRYLFGPVDYLRKVSEEVNHVKLYIQLQHKRYGNAFSCAMDIDDSLMDCFIPKLMLQTLVENSIQHNMVCDRPMEVSLFMTEETIENEKWLYCCVSDTGRGFSNEVMEAIVNGREIFREGRWHIGLSNLKKRLKLMYGNDASFSLSNMAEHYGAIAEVRIKLKKITGNSRADGPQ